MMHSKALRLLVIDTFLVITTSYPLSKALITLCRGEMSERISTARTVSERKAHHTLREKEEAK